MSRYAHSPLDLSKDQFRLVQILSGDAAGNLQCCVKIFERETSPPYTALSYVWRSTTACHDISIDGKMLSITSNLYDFLITATNKDITGEIPYLWIDQISIDQSNTAERNHQVQDMAVIFEGAALVISWLGSGTENDARAIDCIIRTANDFSYLNMADPKAGWPRQWPEEATESMNQYMDDHEDDFERVTEFFGNTYWTRVWIVQEFVLAQNLLLLSGIRSLEWHVLSRFVHIMFTFSQLDIGKQAAEILSCAYSHLVTRSMRWQPDGEVTGATENILLALDVFAELGCKDPRDRIYGLLGISRIGRFVHVNYEKSAQEVFWDTVDWVRCDLWSCSGFLEGYVLRDLFSNIGLAMGVSQEELDAGDFSIQIST